MSNNHISPITARPPADKHFAPSSAIASKKRRLAYAFSWLFIWPVILLLPIIVAGIAGLLLATAVLGYSDDAFQKQSVFAFQLAIVGGVGLLVIVLLLVKWLLTTRKRTFWHIGGKVLGVYIWLGVACGAVAMTGISYKPDIAKLPITQDAELTQSIATIGGDTTLLSDVSLGYVDGYKQPERAGEYTHYDDTDGNFSHGTLTVKRGLDPATQKVVVAHEYLHHMWETQIDQTTLHDLTSQLMTLYGRDDWFKTRVATYSDTNMLLPTELFAFYCTESSDAHLTRYIIDQCNAYIRRDTLRFVR